MRRSVGTLHLSLLGVPVLRRDGVEHTLPLRKALALLAYLAVADGPVSRARLVALLWPARDERAGRAALRSTLSALRRALGEPADTDAGGAATTVGGVLRAEPTVLGVDAGRLALDVATLAVADALPRSLP